MNDEFVLNVDTDENAFCISKDVWGFAFITADNNEKVIQRIDTILINSCLFQKTNVDYRVYK
jgi:hypothetical protein